MEIVVCVCDFVQGLIATEGVILATWATLMMAICIMRARPFLRRAWRNSTGVRTFAVIMREYMDASRYLSRDEFECGCVNAKKVT